MYRRRPEIIKGSKRESYRWVFPLYILFLALPLLFLVGIVLFNGLVLDHPRQEKIADLDAGKVTVSFICPGYDAYHFLIGLPADTPKTITYHGRVLLQESGKRLVEFPFSSESNRSSNWLDPEGLRGDIVIGEAEYDDFQWLSEYLQPGKAYEATFEFSELPDGASLWLSWVAHGWNQNTIFHARWLN